MTLADAYARALMDSAAAQPHAPETVLKAFIASLQRRGHTPLLPSILRACDRLLRFRSLRAPKLVVARPEDEAAFREEISRACTALALPEAAPAWEIDPTLIGGFMLTTGARRWDASHKRALIELYAALRGVATRTAPTTNPKP